MAIKKLVKRFEFNDRNLARIDLSGGLIVALRSPRGLQLPRQDVDFGPSAKEKPYSLDQTLTARTWVTNPKALRKWLGFQVERRRDPPSPDPEIQTTPVTIQFRLTNGTDDLWWDGASWAVPVNPSDWNTEAEIADNIETFPLSGRKLGVIINMFTIDERVTPRIETVKALYEADINEHHDIVYESLIPELKSLQARGRVIIEMPADSTTIDFSDLEALGFDSRYKIVDIAAVYNATADPEKLTDLFASFDLNSGLLTMTAQAQQGDLVWVHFLFSPDVAVNTGRDYYEISTIPRIDVTSLSFVDVLPAGSSTSASDSYFHPVTGAGYKIPGPREFDMFAVLELLADKQYDLTSMKEAVTSWVAANPELVMVGTDEGYNMISEGQVDDVSTPNEDDERIYKMPLLVSRITSYDLPAEATAAPNSILFQGGNLEFEISKA